MSRPDTPAEPDRHPGSTGVPPTPTGVPPTRADGPTAPVHATEEHRTGRPDRERRRTIALVGCIAAAVVLVLIGAYWYGVSSADPDDGNGGTDDAVPGPFEARLACEDFVSDRLKAPATAEFGDAEVITTGADSYLVTGVVDAQNGFGAFIRSDYSCEVDYLDDHWVLGSMDIY